MTEAQHIAWLLFKELEGRLSEAEEAELQVWKAANPKHLALHENVKNEEELAQLIQLHHPANKERARMNIERKMAGQLDFNVKPMYRRPFFRVAVAACIALLISLGGYYLLINKQKPDLPAIAEGKDIKAPESNRAMITLVDGSTVYLDSANNGQLAVQGNVQLVKLANGQIAYQTLSGEVITEIKYNTLTNPRGSKVIDMALADGSHVWLNAGSSVTYPIAFVGNERKVAITGEAYFEVASDKTKPFKVSKGDMTVEVLGTHFNVSAYDDEENIKVTLLEGSVNVSNEKQSLTIKPYQQAVVTTSNVILNNDVDVEAVMAWKNGRFQFEGYSIEQVLRQIEKWYDVEVVYEAKPQDQHFGGGISRNVEVSKVLNMLETTEAVHFRIEGRKIVVVK